LARIYFVRHGEGLANAGGVTMEHAIIPLSPLGVAQAATVADILDVEPSKVLVSKYLRSRDTAQPFCDS
jgi:alpha-ribazole phosphatase